MFGNVGETQNEFPVRTRRCPGDDARGGNSVSKKPVRASCSSQCPCMPFAEGSSGDMVMMGVAIEGYMTVSRPEMTSAKDTCATLDL